MSTSSTRPRRGRPRRPETDRRILDTALSLLREQGPGSLTVESVSSASGVARTTIYRRYRDRRALLAAALDELAHRPPPAPGLPVEATLRWVLDGVAELVEDGVGRGVVAAVLAGTDPELTEALRGSLRDRVAALRALVDEDLASGALARPVDAEVLAGLLLGAYLGEVVLHGQARPGWSDGVVDLLGGVLGHDGPGASF